MKLIILKAAFVLPLILIACEERTANNDQKQSNLTMTVMKSPEPAKPVQKIRLTPPKTAEDKEEIVTSPEEENSKDIPDNTEEYDRIVENTFLTSIENPLSTFSIDVDEAAYSNIRRYLQHGSLPPNGAVRIEEMVNYFDYSYPKPQKEEPFTINTEIAECPWNTKHRLVHVGLQGKDIPVENLPAANLVFLVDVSGSMNEPNKLPLVQSSLNMLTDELRPDDKVAIVVYAGQAGLVLPSTSGIFKTKIKEAINVLQAGGSTAGGEGIKLAYKTAAENFISGGNNRIILATDGDFNVGISSDDELVRLIETERKSGVYLSVLGFGMGNYKDSKMQQLADKGNGNHSYIDNINEARKVLVSEFGSTLFTIAKDVKIQIEFNPVAVQAYRLIGYENRMLAAEDFNDDKKDAGEIGPGHTVTALYEIIPVGIKNEFFVPVDSLKYQRPTIIFPDAAGNEMMTIKLRYKSPDENISKLMVHSVGDKPAALSTTSDNFRFSAAVAEFGLLLRSSEYKEQASYSQVISLAESARGKDENGYRTEFIQLVQAATALAKNK